MQARIFSLPIMLRMSPRGQLDLEKIRCPYHCNAGIAERASRQTSRSVSMRSTWTARAAGSGSFLRFSLRQNLDLALGNHEVGRTAIETHRERW